MKKLLLLSLSLSVLCFTAYAGYYLWKQEKAKSEKIERLNSYYYKEFKYAYTDMLSPGSPKELISYELERIEETEKHMLQDGYDRAEIDNLRTNAYEEASRKL